MLKKYEKRSNLCALVAALCAGCWLLWCLLPCHDALWVLILVGLSVLFMLSFVMSACYHVKGKGFHWTLGLLIMFLAAIICGFILGETGVLEVSEGGESIFLLMSPVLFVIVVLISLLCIPDKRKEGNECS